MILYFSGTGNSRYAAELIQQVTGDEMVCLNELIKTGQRREFANDRPLVLVAPTYAWRLPRLVSDYLQGSTFSGNRQAYFLLTCGDGVGAAAAFANHLCRQKGLTFMGLAAVVMPENYIALFQAPGGPEAAAIIRRAEPQLRQLGEQIAAGLPLPSAKPGLFGRVCSWLVNPLFYRFIIKAKAFCTTEKCVGCGRCAKLCPINNIRLVDGTPQWGAACTHCMACICGCPAQAIEYGRSSQGKVRYYNTASPQ